MPTYEYRCPKGHDFEHFVPKISESVAELPCPTCGAIAVRRISAGGVLLFKGSGFYITDYKKAAKGEGATGEAKGESATREAKGEPAKAAPPAAADSKKTPSAPEKPKSGGGE